MTKMVETIFKCEVCGEQYGHVSSTLDTDCNEIAKDMALLEAREAVKGFEQLHSKHREVITLKPCGGLNAD